jgi:hypothetical protein
MHFSLFPIECKCTEKRRSVLESGLVRRAKIEVLDSSFFDKPDRLGAQSAGTDISGDWTALPDWNRRRVRFADGPGARMALRPCRR